MEDDFVIVLYLLLGVFFIVWKAGKLWDGRTKPVVRGSEIYTRQDEGLPHSKVTIDSAALVKAEKGRKK